MRKLRRATEHSMIAGICAGISYWLGIPTWLVRVVWGVALFFYGVGLGIYILLWIFMPTWDRTPNDYKDFAGD